MNYNNLKYFMKLFNLNNYQTRQIIKLLIFNFIITYRPNKINLVNAPSRRSNYKSKNKLLN